MTGRLILVLTVFLAVGTSPYFFHYAHACSCIEMTEQEAFEGSFASFVGSPVKTEFASDHSNLVTFQIERPIKNIPDDMTEISLSTPTQGSAYGYEFKNHTRYLVHTYERENQKDLGTGLCSGNQNLGFSSIPLMMDETAMGIHPESVSWNPVDLYLIIAGIISSVVMVLIVYNKKGKQKTKQ